MTKKSARALVSRVMIVIALVFVIVSTSQIILALFGAPTRLSTDNTNEALCAGKMRGLERALDRASDRARRTSDEAAATAAFAAELSPEWNDVADTQSQCEVTPHGKEAWAALIRLRHAFEERTRRDAREIGPARADFETRLP